MTLTEILTHEQLRRREFPVTAEHVFLAHAGVCPLPLRVAEAIRAYAAQCAEGDQESFAPAHQLPRIRALAASLIGAQPEEIALVGPTTLALSFVAQGLPMNLNDNILVYYDDYPSNVYPWAALARKGVRVRRLRTPALGCIRLEDIQSQVDEQTRLVALASCHFISGYRIDISAIGRFLRARNIWFCVDGIQTLGAFPTPVEGVDFLAADAHKWLLGPCAAGILYVRQSVQETLQPAVWGWNNVQCPHFIAQESLVFRPDARRYEGGTPNYLGLTGLQAALEMIAEVGVDNIANELWRKRALLAPQLRHKGYTVLHGEALQSNTGGLVSFYRPETDMAALHYRLQEKGIITSLRTDRSGQKYIRVSPHFYNTEEELERAVEWL